MSAIVPVPPEAATPEPPTREQRYAQIKGLVEAGFAERVLLGNDHPIVVSLDGPADEWARRAQNPDGVLFITRKVIPALKAMGVSEAVIRAMTVEAPRRFFEGG